MGKPAGRGLIDPAAVTRAVHLALDHDVVLFDVGNIYGAGDAERLLGNALASSASGEKAVLQVKFGGSFDEVTRNQIDYEAPLAPEWIENSLHGSLRRLRRDVVDIFQCQLGQYPADALPALFEQLNGLVAAGKIRSYSVGTPDVELAGAFAAQPHCAAILHSHNVLQPAGSLLQLTADHGVASLGGIPYMLGLLANPDAATRSYADDDLRHTIFSHERFQTVAQRVASIAPLLQSDGRTLAQGALAWIWAQAEHAIPLAGFRRPEQVREAIAALDKGPLSAAIVAAIDAALER